MEKKLRGFTIIELMVVITIIAVLCAIGVPAALTWVRDARMRDANEEARLVYSAVQDYLTELEIKNIDLSSTQDYITSASDSGIGTLNDMPSSANKSAWATVFWSGKDAYDFGEALGENYDGVWVVKFNQDTYTVEHAWWTPLPNGGSFTFNGVPEAYSGRTEQEADFASSGIAIGQFPI